MSFSPKKSFRSGKVSYFLTIQRQNGQLVLGPGGCGSRARPGSRAREAGQDDLEENEWLFTGKALQSLHADARGPNRPGNSLRSVERIKRIQSDKVMSEAIPIKNAECNLEELLKEPVFWGIPFIGPEGGPVALLVSLRPGKIIQKPAIDWDTRMDDLARKVSRAWSGEKSAVDVLSEMRR